MVIFSEAKRAKRSFASKNLIREIYIKFFDAKLRFALLASLKKNHFGYLIFDIKWSQSEAKTEKRSFESNIKYSIFRCSALASLCSVFSANKKNKRVHSFPVPFLSFLQILWECWIRLDVRKRELLSRKIRIILILHYYFINFKKWRWLFYRLASHFLLWWVIFTNCNIHFITSVLWRVRNHFWFFSESQKFENYKYFSEFFFALAKDFLISDCFPSIVPKVNWHNPKIKMC